MNPLPAGGNIAITTHEVEIFVNWTPQTSPVDICAFLLSAGQKVRSDEDFIFNRHPTHQESFIRLSDEGYLQQCFHIDLAKIPASVEKIVFVATAQENLTTLSALTIEVKEAAIFSPPLAAMRSLILGELYLRNQQWKFKAVGQGFKEGMEFLTQHYGIKTAPQDYHIQTQEKQPPVIKIKQPDVIAPSNIVPKEEVLDAVVERIPRPPAPQKLNPLQMTVKMVKELSWSWVFSSFAAFIVLELLLGGLLGNVVLGRFVSHILVYQIEVLLVLTSFFVGGMIIGFVSPAIRILEPAIAAFLSVFSTLIVGFFSPYRFIAFSWEKLLIGGSIAFLLAFFGARFGEKLSAKFGNKNSREFFGNEE